MPISIIGAKAPVFTVAIDYFIVQTTVTSRGDDAERWINQILRNNRNYLHRLLVGLGVQLRAENGIRTSICVLQICVGFRCLVFQVLHADFIPLNLFSFLLDRRFTFVGIAIQNAARLLAHDYNLHVVNTLDLGSLVVSIMLREDLRNAGLRRLAEEVLRLSVENLDEIVIDNWEINTLSHNQITYACGVSFLSFEIGRRLRNLQF